MQCIHINCLYFYILMQTKESTACALYPYKSKARKERQEKGRDDLSPNIILVGVTVGRARTDRQLQEGLEPLLGDLRDGFLQLLVCHVHELHYEISLVEQEESLERPAGQREMISEWKRADNSILEKGINRITRMHNN